jgi:hypothetical protein
MTTVEDVLRVHAEGRAAGVGAANPYAGQTMVLAAVWLHGYREMLDDMLANSPARQAWLREQRRRGAGRGRSGLRR